MKAVFDTNILVDYLRGDERAKSEIEACTQPLISVVTWIEIMVGVKDPAEEAEMLRFLKGFSLIGLTRGVAELTIQIRRTRKIRLPDAIIWATAKAEGCLLVTRNFRDFPKDDIGVRIPYHVH